MQKHGREQRCQHASWDKDQEASPKATNRNNAAVPWASLTAGCTIQSAYLGVSMHARAHTAAEKAKDRTCDRCGANQRAASILHAAPRLSGKRRAQRSKDCICGTRVAVTSTAPSARPAPKPSSPVPAAARLVPRRITMGSECPPQVRQIGRKGGPRVIEAHPSLLIWGDRFSQRIFSPPQKPKRCVVNRHHVVCTLRGFPR